MIIFCKVTSTFPIHTFGVADLQTILKKTKKQNKKPLTNPAEHLYICLKIILSIPA